MQHQRLVRAALPRRHLLTAAAALLAISSCRLFAQTIERAETMSARLRGLAGAAVLLLGEQHDAPDHQRLAVDVVQALAHTGQLAGVVMEMLPIGRSSRAISPSAGADEIQQTLAWDNGAWPWTAYADIVTAAVRAGVPVLGGDLPRHQLREAMSRTDLDRRLPPAALARQMQWMREGHCQLLPESQILPMARMQIARDISLAQACVQVARTARPGQTVLLICGSVHADKALGVPQHLPDDLISRSVRLIGRGVDAGDGQFDAHWLTEPGPVTDHCAALREQFKSRPAAKP
jgi:uncharacterized iron-regulated protein